MFRNGKYFIVLLIFLSACLSQSSEEGKTAIPSTGIRIAFYNVENLFDTKDDPATEDEDFLSASQKRWTEERYQQKLVHLAEVVAALEYPALIGLAEVENEAVLRDLLAQDQLKDQEYAILHDESPDARGIDVALLYRSIFFTPFLEESLAVKLDNDATTREILKVGGIIGNKQDTLYVLVNHWPSRRGGMAKSAPRRKKAAAVARTNIDQWLRKNKAAQIIVMGDFNDEPTNPSIFQVLEAKGNQNKLDDDDLFNPMYALQKNGEGSYQFRNHWHMLDQIMLSQQLLSGKTGGMYYKPGSVHVFWQKWLLQSEGKYAGYPDRTYAGNKYLGGYSDHLPVYIELGVK